MSEIQNERKRKRQQNTNQEQYELYLSHMENDYIFRSNTINPTLNPEYLNNKWKELCLELNSIGKGPALSVDDWKKRFSDWKYATKSKHRKITEHAKKTGSGPKLPLQLTATEERGLAVWGKVTVLGTTATKYQGFVLQDNEILTEVTVNEDETAEAISPEVTLFNETIEEEQSMISTNQKNTKDKEETQPTPRVRHRLKPMSVLAENLIQSSDSANLVIQELNDTLKSFGDNCVDLKKKELALEREKFQFEVAKYKFCNKDFDF